jgi:hypothetical protein
MREMTGRYRFYNNYESAKGQDRAENPNAEVLFSRELERRFANSTLLKLMLPNLATISKRPMTG